MKIGKDPNPTVCLFLLQQDGVGCLDEAPYCGCGVEEPTLGEAGGAMGPDMDNQINSVFVIKIILAGRGSSMSSRKQLGGMRAAMHASDFRYSSGY